MSRQLSAGRLREKLGLISQKTKLAEKIERVLGGRISVMNTFGDSAAKLPPGSTASAPDQIRFAELQLGDCAILGNDVPQNEVAPMQGFHIALHLKTVMKPDVCSKRFPMAAKLRRLERGGVVIRLRDPDRPVRHALADPGARQVTPAVPQHVPFDHRRTGAGHARRPEGVR